MSLITIIGGNGYIGRHLSCHFQKKGHKVNIIGKKNKKLNKKNMGHVIYAAGVTSDFRLRPFDAVKAHVCYLCEVLQTFKYESFLYLSSTRVYLSSKNTMEVSPITVESYKEEDLYCLSKLLGESLVLQNKKKKTRVARLSNVIGGIGMANTFFADLVKQAKSGKLYLQSSLKNKKDYIHINDCCEMLENVVFQGRHSIYNIASGQRISTKLIVNHLKTVYPFRLSISPLAPFTEFFPISIQRFREEFSFRPQSAIKAIQELQ